MKAATIDIFHPTQARVRGADFSTLNNLDELLAVPNPAAEHIKRRARMRHQAWAKNWDGKTHLLNVQTGIFPVGLVRTVQQALEGAKYKVTLQDSRKCAIEAPAASQRVSEAMLNGVTLRDYQVKGVLDAIQNLGGIFHLATNAGKTAVGAALIHAINRPTLYMVPNTKLITQTRKALADFLRMKEDDIGEIRGGVWKPKQITIGIVNSMAPKDPAKKKLVKEYLKTVEHLILDEVHHAAAKTWMNVAKYCPASWRFGLSGTPFDRTDGRSIFVEAYCGPVVARVSNKHLIDAGHSARPLIRMREVGRVIDYNGVELDYLPGRYADVYKAGIVRNKFFHDQIIEDTLAHVSQKRPVLVLVRELEHGFALQERFEDEGFGGSMFVHGKMSSEDVEDAKDQFKKGTLKVLIASPVFGEGQNLPQIRALVIADDFKSVILILQRIGRGLREKAGQNVLHVTDYGHIAHHYLAEHSLARLNVYEREGFDITDEST